MPANALTVLVEATDKATSTLHSVASSMNTVGKSADQMKIELLKAEEAAQKLATRANQTGTELDRLKADQAAQQVAKLSAEMENANASAAKFGVIIGGASLAVISFASTVTALAVAFASSFETSTVDFQNQANTTTAATKEISDALLDMSKDSEFSGKALVDALAPVAGRLETVRGAALDVASSLEVMKAAGDLAEASQTDLKDATAGLVNVMLTYKKPVEDAASVSDQLFNISRVTGVSIGELSTGIDRLAAKLGDSTPSVSEVGTLLTAMAASGQTGSRGLLAFSSAMTSLTSGSDAVNTALHNLGVGVFDANGNFIGIRNTIAELNPVFAKMTEAQQRAAAEALGFGGATGVLLALIRGGTDAFDQFSKRIDAQGTAAAAAARDDDTLGVQIKILHNNVNALATEFGQKLEPAIKAVTEQLNPLLTAITENEQVMTVIAIVAGTVLATALAIAGAAFINMAVGMAAATLAGIGLSGGLLLIPIAIAAIIAASYLLVKNWDTVWPALQAAPQAFLDWLQAHWADELILIIAGPLPLVVKYWRDIFDHLPEPVQDALIKVGGVIDAVLNSTIIPAINGIITAVNSLIGVWNTIAPALSIAVKVVAVAFLPIIIGIHTLIAEAGFLYDHWQSIWAGMLAVVVPVFDAIVTLVRTDIAIVIGTFDVIVAAWDAVWNDFISPVVDAVSGVADIVGTVIGGVVDVIAQGVDLLGAAWEKVAPVVEPVIKVMLILAAISLAPLIAAIAATVAALTVLLIGAQKLKQNWDVIWGAIVATVETAAGAVSAAVGAAFGAIAGVVLTAFNAVAGVVTTVFGAIAVAAQAAFGATVAVVQTVFGIIVTVIETAMAAGTAAVSAGIAAMTATFDAIQAAWSVTWATLTAIVDAIMGAVVAVVSADINLLVSVFPAIATAWDAVWSALSGIVGTAMDAVLSVVDTAINFLTPIFDTILSAWEDVWNGVLSPVQGAMTAVVGAVQSGIQWVIDNVLDPFLGKLGGAADVLGALTGGKIDLHVEKFGQLGGSDLSGIFSGEQGGGGSDRTLGSREDRGTGGAPDTSKADALAAALNAINNAAGGATPTIRGIVPALAGTGGGGGGSGGGGVAGAAKTATKALSQTEEGLIALAAGFDAFHAQTGEGVDAYREYLAAQRLVTQQTQQLADDTEKGRIELRALAIVLGNAGISAAAFTAQQGLKALAAAYDTVGGTVDNFILKLHGFTDAVLNAAKALNEETGKAVFGYNMPYYESGGIGHAGSGFGTNPKPPSGFDPNHTDVTPLYPKNDPLGLRGLGFYGTDWSATERMQATQKQGMTINNYGQVAVTAGSASELQQTLKAALR